MNMNRAKPQRFIWTTLCAAFLSSSTTFAAQGGPAVAGNKAVSAENRPNAGAKQDSGDDPGYVVKSSTKIDFSETSIDGKMKAPEGFYLQGRNAQKMQNLLRLRQDFKKELEGSGEAAQTEYK